MCRERRPPSPRPCSLQGERGEPALFERAKVGRLEKKTIKKADP
ncbi:hypothetical protein HMPREF0262_02716 [Clostridium sp. ATCC 29733]|nr:hypothetical protein HMPREF0262_02716 [Clostridium sp. ATCC 29733]